MTILPDLSDLVIEQVSITNEVTITVRAASPTASCLCCGAMSKRVQSRYTRTLRDLPASGRPVHLKVQVRRFFCQKPSCNRKIFAERFPSLTLPRVKFTLRLQEALREIGFELGGEAPHASPNIVRAISTEGKWIVGSSASYAERAARLSSSAEKTGLAHH
jgi:transposase